ALHRHPVQADGLLYMSRHVNSDKAVVLFERAAAKLKAATYTPLPKVRNALEALMKLKVSVQYL
ncbi:MAG: RES domain-containing protein, partial [Burkholderiaceae bacterium]